jgi:transmembrane sensor
MEKEFENIDVLLAKFFAGEALETEIKTLEDWRQMSVENNVYFEESKNVFELLKGTNVPQTVDVDTAWNKLNTKITAKPKIIQLKKVPTVLAAAASLLLLATFVLIITWFTQQTNVEPLIIKAENKTIEKTLPDGSKVFLNKNSELAYKENKQGHREVSLKGEAFFEVTHNEKKPFLISINEVLIKDIGTAFNVKENAANNSIEVFVESGTVQFYSKTNGGLILTAGEKAVFNHARLTFTKEQNKLNDNIGSYRTKNFVFNATLLSEVVGQLKAVYGCEIRFSEPSIGNERLSVVFTNESLSTVLSIISETLDLEVEKENGVFLLKRKTAS